MGGGPLVGRRREEAELERALDDASAGRGTLFVVSGEAGVGKTRLADAVSAVAAQRGFRVLWGRCWEAGGAPAYWPWVRVLRELARTEDDAALAAHAGDGAAPIARLVPQLGDRLGVAPGAAPELDGERGRFALFDAVASFLRAAAADGPLLVVLDDLHAADRPSLGLLQFVARELHDARVVLLATYREEEARADRRVAEALAELGREGRRLPLRGLGEHDVGELLAALTGEQPADTLVAAIHRATEGNPFYVDEVVRLLSAQGGLDTAAADALEIPDSVREAVRRRLEPLSPAAREALAVAAVVGREWSLGVVARVTGRTVSDLHAALADALDAGVVAERPGAPGRFAFTHMLFGETLYGDLRAVDRVTLHRSVGEALEELHAADPEPHLDELAHHFFQASAAGQSAKAIRYAVLAGERALGLLAFEEAARHYERALQAFGLEERADVPRRCDVLLALGEAQGRAGDVAQARATFLRAAGLARGLRSPERLARAALGYGAGAGGYELGRVDEVLVGLLEEARRALEPSDGPLHARVLGRLATELYAAPEEDRRTALAEAAVAMARRTGDPDALASTLTARHLALWNPVNAPERLATATEVVHLGRSSGDRELVLRGHVWRLVDLLELGDVTAVDAELEAIARLGDALRDPLLRWYVPLFRAMRAIADGRLDQGEALAAEAHAVGARLQPANAMTLFSAQLFALRFFQRRLDEVVEALAGLADRFPSQPAWRSAYALACAETGREDEARSQLDLLAAGGFSALPRDGEWVVGLAVLADTAATVGDAERATQLHELLAPFDGRFVVGARAAVTFGPVARYLGRLAATWGDTAAARAHLEDAVEQAAAGGLRLVLERARTDLAALRGRPAPAAADERRRAALVREGEVWTARFDGRHTRLKDVKGLHYLAELLAKPGVEVHAAELVGAAVVEGDAGAPLDHEAKREYRARLEALREEAEEARRFADPERAARAEEEIAFLTRELASAVGLGGRDRHAGSTAERARVNATRALRAAVERIAEHDDVLGAHLRAALRTGTYCAYCPDPASAVEWEVDR